MATSATDEQELLAAARRGDQEAFGRLLQETLVRAWRGLPHFEGRSSLRSWLFQIATNACLRLIERRPKRVLPIEHGPAAALHEAPDRRGLHGCVGPADVHALVAMLTRAGHLVDAAGRGLRVGPERRSYPAHALDVLTLDGPRIQRVTAFHMPAIFRRFGLPDELPLDVRE